MEQVGLPFFMVWDTPEDVPAAVVEQFGSTTDAFRWSFKNRTDPNGKSIEWLAKHLGMRRSTLSRLINHGDFNMNPAKVHLWDRLVGNNAVSKFVEFSKEKLEKQIIQGRMKVIEQTLHVKNSIGRVAA